MSGKIKVGILAATGSVGQRFVQLLDNHPLFEVVALTGSDRGTGKTYGEVCRWLLPDAMPAWARSLPVLPTTAAAVQVPLVFSGLPTEIAKDAEKEFAMAGIAVCSNASAYRKEEDVPILLPEVNPEHIGIIPTQQKNHGWSGWIVTNPNCTSTVLVMALAPLQAAFGIEALMMTSMQAVSGAGYPGVPSLDILGNVIPFIRNEEEKVEEETPKLLGTFAKDHIELAPMVVTALCHRVPVLEGHTEAVCVKLKGDPSPEDVREAMIGWTGEPQLLGLPTAPPVPIHVHDEPDRPQVRKDVEGDGGMSVHVGRIRRCPLLGIKFTLLGHNTERGAAGASILNAELAHAKGYV